MCLQAKVFRIWKTHLVNLTVSSERVHGSRYGTKCYLFIPLSFLDSESRFQKLGSKCFFFLIEFPAKNIKTMSCRLPLSVAIADIHNQIYNILKGSWKNSQNTLAGDHCQLIGADSQDKMCCHLFSVFCFSKCGHDSCFPISKFPLLHFWEVMSLGEIKHLSLCATHSLSNPLLQWLFWVTEAFHAHGQRHWFRNGHVSEVGSVKSWKEIF